MTQERYLALLREYRPEFAEFLTHCSAGTAEDSERQFILRRARALAERGTPCGYDAIAALAEALQHAIEAKAPCSLLAHYTGALLETCHMVLNFSSGCHLPALLALRSGANKEAAQKPRLLIVDDDRVIRETLRYVFEEETELLIACNGREAYHMIERYQPHLVILDDFMPEMTGLKLLETLRFHSSLKNTAVIMLTASSRPQDIRRGMQAGVLEYIAKPFDPASLTAIVRAYFKKHFHR